MHQQFNVRLISFFVILVLAGIWLLGAFGSPMGFKHNDTLWYRGGSHWAIGITALVGLFILPRQATFPKIPWPLWASFLFLILWGSFMYFNAEADHENMRFPGFEMVAPEDRPFPDLPGTAVSHMTKFFTIEVAVVFLFVMMLARSTESDAWKGIVKIIAIATAVVAVIGIGHKTLGVETIWGIPDEEQVETFFAPYVSTANAASFMNLGVLISFALALETHRAGNENNGFIGWTVCGAIASTGVIIAASKAGALVWAGQLGLFLLIQAKYLFRLLQRRRRSNRRLSLEQKFALGVALVLFSGFGIVSAGYLNTRVDQMLEEIDEQGKASTVDGRVAMIKLMGRLSVDPENSFWHGFGPGSFAHVNTYYITKEDTDLHGARWDYGHCDPMQTIIEWGYFGALCWFTIGLGALFRGGYLILKRKIPEEDLHLVKAMLVSLVGVGIHSLFDFPLSTFSIHIIAIAYCGILWTLYRRPPVEPENLA